MAPSSWRIRLFGELTWRRAARSVAEVYFGVWIVGLVFVDKLMFHPPERRHTDGPNALKLTTSDGGHISATWIERPGAKLTLLVSHGNAEDLYGLRPTLRDLSRIGFSVLGYDYRGFGASDGSPSEEHAYRDIDAAYDWLTKDRGIDPRRIVAFGRSIGGGPSVDLAARRAVGGVVLDSPFLSAFRVATRFPIFAFDRFVNRDKIGAVHCPLLVIHARRDPVVPFWHGEELYRRAHEPKRALWLDGDGHTAGQWTDAARYEQALKELAALVEANATVARGP